jgi:hypothetical protein
MIKYALLSCVAAACKQIQWQDEMIETRDAASVACSPANDALWLVTMTPFSAKKGGYKIAKRNGNKYEVDET